MLRSLIAKIPHRHIVSLGRLVGTAMYFADLPHRRLARRNLQFCYPRWSRGQINGLCREIFKNAGITFLEIWQMAFLTREQVLGMIQGVKGIEHGINALKKKRGLVVISAHLGNWELSFVAGGCYLDLPVTAVARHIRFGWLDRLFYRLRTRFGNRIIFKKDALSEMRKVLRGGEILVITLDQSRQKQAVEVDFFGHRATATPGAALLAMRCKSPVLAGFCRRDARGRLYIELTPPIELQRTGDLRADLQVNTQKMVAVMENQIRRCPEQWIWFQRPWKKTHPELYPRWSARRLKKKKRRR